MSWVDPARGNTQELPDNFCFDLTTCPFCDGEGLAMSTISIGGLGTIEKILPCLMCNGAGMVEKSEYDALARTIKKVGD
jgi:DnaJ-class molecular chaperone